MSPRMLLITMTILAAPPLKTTLIWPHCIALEACQGKPFSDNAVRWSSGGHPWWFYSPMKHHMKQRLRRRYRSVEGVKHICDTTNGWHHNFKQPIKSNSLQLYQLGKKSQKEGEMSFLCYVRITTNISYFLFKYQQNMWHHCRACNIQIYDQHWDKRNWLHIRFLFETIYDSFYCGKLTYWHYEAWQDQHKHSTKWVNVGIQLLGAILEID